MLSNQRGVLFMVLFVMVAFIIFISTQTNAQVRSIKLMASTDLPMPFSPNLPHNFPQKSTREGFTVGFEKRNHPPLPEEVRPRVVQSSIATPPPIPSSAYESVGIYCQHGNCDYTEQKESASRATYQENYSYLQENIPQPNLRGYPSQSVYHAPAFRAQVEPRYENAQQNTVPYQSEMLPIPRGQRIREPPNYTRTISDGPISPVPYQREMLPEPRGIHIQNVPNYNRVIESGPLHSGSYQYIFGS
jgi:hypothetical protein